MGHINNYKYNNLDLRLSNDEYYDLYLSNDEYYVDNLNNIVSGDTLITEFDFNNQLIYEDYGYSAQTIYSLSTWPNAVNTGVTLDNIGLTGLDNGFIPYEKNDDDYNNTGLTHSLTGTTLEISSGNTELILNPVTGYTNNYVYPMEILESETVGFYSHLCGGFYQGFFKLNGYKYEVLPTRFNEGWTIEFWLNKTDTICLCDTTKLNDEHIDNTGFIFYLGTRAENKYWSIFDGLNSAETINCSGLTEFCTLSKEHGLTTTDSYPLNPPPLDLETIDNKFLIYSRADGTGAGCGHGSTREQYSWISPGGDEPFTKTDVSPRGKTIGNFRDDSLDMVKVRTKITDKRNKFTFFSRSEGRTGCFPGSTGGTRGALLSTYSGDTRPILELDYKRDLINNAFGIRIKNDGSIGYRALRHSCISGTNTTQTGVTVEESYSSSGMVNDDIWTHVSVKFIPDNNSTNCDLQNNEPRNGKLLFYVNARLKHTVNDFTEIIPKQLNEYYKKQEGVPYNISIGGGTQGLLESMTFDGQDPNDLNLLLEQNFAGSFYGGISKFRMYDKPLSWCEIKNNYNIEANNFGQLANEETFLLALNEDSDYLLLQNNGCGLIF